MVRMKVDFPDPDGPKTTTTSPLLIVVDTPLSAWNAPNHLCTSRQTIISSVVPVSSLAVTGPSVVSDCLQSRAHTYRAPTRRWSSTRLLTYDIPYVKIQKTMARKMKSSLALGRYSGLPWMNARPISTTSSIPMM